MKSVLFFAFSRTLASGSLWDPHPLKLVQGKNVKILAKAAQELRTAGFHNGLQNGCIRRYKPGLRNNLLYFIHFGSKYTTQKWQQSILVQTDTSLHIQKFSCNQGQKKQKKSI